jgi:hypothetical protein
MAEVIHNLEQEFWQPPAVHAVGQPQEAPPRLVSACQRCHTEFLLGARYCHACGSPRVQPVQGTQSGYLSVVGHFTTGADRLLSMADDISWHKVTFPAWVQYLHFHEIRRWIALPTASFVAFLIGLGCVAGAIGVSLVYKAENFVDFQAIQMWRIEWLLAATASFVAGILLKRPSSNNKDQD